MVDTCLGFLVVIGIGYLVWHWLSTSIEREMRHDEIDQLLDLAVKERADGAARFAQMEADHKARVERIQKQMDETRKHMEEW